MQTLKKIISRYLTLTTLIFVIIILAVTVCIQINMEENRAYDSSIRTFSQIEQLLDRNHKELEEITESYNKTCLHNAEVIARIIEGDPDVLDNVEELKKIAEAVEVDEIHIFNQNGCIYTGTHPEYYGYTFDSGEQMNFFKPMLEDRSLQLVQEIMPNTAEGKIMQYSALWSKSGEFIVQIGMEPVSVMKVTEKNRLSYIFSLFRVNTEVNYYAIDADTQEIVGSTVLDDVGKSLTDTGLTLDAVKNNKKGFHANVNGQRSFCIFKESDGTWLGRIISDRELYQRIPSFTALLAICLVVIAIALICGIKKYMNKYVINSIDVINDKLCLITKGNLDERVRVNSSLEFQELSNYINAMVKSLLDNNKKMSYVLSKTNMYIGVYEYIKYSNKVRFTEYIPKILCLDDAKMQQLSSDYRIFRDFIDRIYAHPVADEEGIYQLDSLPVRYLKLEELEDENEIFGVVIDVTEEVLQRQKMKFERDNDLLTGLYNRRGLDTCLSGLLSCPEKLGHSALVMIDADGLKTVNDTYGHEKGDLYLKEISSVLKNFAPGNSIAARQSGDEFILFLYDYKSGDDLLHALRELACLQEHSSVALDSGLIIPLRFSFGYCLTENAADYQELIKRADEKMYHNKRKRKAEMREETDIAGKKGGLS